MATDTIAFPTPSIPLPAANAAQGGVAPGLTGPILSAGPDPTLPKYSIGDKVYLKGSWSSNGAAIVDSITTEFTLFEGVTHRYTISWPIDPYRARSVWGTNLNDSIPRIETVTEDQLSSEPTTNWAVSGMIATTGMSYWSTGISDKWHTPLPARRWGKTAAVAHLTRSIPKEPTSLDRYNPAEPSPL
jgi:hypothetical protein